VRNGSYLQRRLVQLESVIKVPTVEGQWAEIQAEALSHLSIEDLRILRDIEVKQAAGITVEDAPLHHEVVERCNSACDEARAKHLMFAQKTQIKRQDSYR
jgi:hypothetical protein